jgi:hypothetical protein
MHRRPHTHTYTSTHTRTSTHLNAQAHPGPAEPLFCTASGMGLQDVMLNPYTCNSDTTAPATTAATAATDTTAATTTTAATAAAVCAPAAEDVCGSVNMSFTVEVRDAFGNLRSCGGDNVGVHVTPLAVPLVALAGGVQGGSKGR